MADTTILSAHPDGRTARRERNRTAVVDAHIDLVLETGDVPSPEAVASRAGVSVSSVFRYFPTLADLQQHAVTVYFERFGQAFEIPQIGEGPIEERLRRFVHARIGLHESVAPIARLTRQRGHESGPIAERLAQVRASFADQVRRHFAEELSAHPRAEADRRATAVDVLTSFEAFDLLAVAHRRSTQEIRRTWTVALTALLAPG